MRRKPYRKIGEWVATGTAAIGVCVIPFLPRRAVLRLARILGDTAYLLMRRFRRVALANLEAAYGKRLSDTRRRTLVRAVFRNFALSLLDVFWFTFRNRSRLSAYVQFDPSFDVCLRTRPLIAVSAHLGNWEVLGQACSLRGCSYISLAQPLSNRLVDWMLRTFRRHGGQAVVAREGGLRALLRVLRQGGRTALLVDQNTVPSKGGVYVEFFGLPVPISAAPYLLSKLSGAPLVFLYAVSNKRGTYHVKASALFGADGDLDSATSLVQHIARLTEAAIRRYPAQWLWMYKRWRYVAPGRSRDGYPDYAIPLPSAFVGRMTQPTVPTTDSPIPTDPCSPRRVLCTL